MRTLALFALALVSLVGQGERFQIDSRFRSPGATLQTYWRALRYGDVQTVEQCFTDAGSSLPFPGMLWFLPPVDEIKLYSVRLVGAEAGHLVAVYEVRFRPAGSTDIESCIITTELRQVSHEWRIVPPSDDGSMPAWQPYRRSVDI